MEARRLVADVTGLEYEEHTIGLGPGHMRGNPRAMADEAIADWNHDGRVVLD